MDLLHISIAKMSRGAGVLKKSLKIVGTNEALISMVAAPFGVNFFTKTTGL